MRIGLAVILFAIPGTAWAQESPWKLGERVELYASAGRWQSCEVIDPGSAESVMRMRCDPYDDGVYKRAGGNYTETITSNGVRRPAATAAPRPAAGARPGAAPARPQAPTTGGGYTVGQKVELEASGHWVPCTVSEITPFDPEPMIRAHCPAYPALSRAAGTYIVHNNQTGIRPATGQTGPAPKPAAPPPRPQAPLGNALPLGEYACYGQGGQILGGWAFKVTAPGRYTDLEGGNAGSFTVSAGTIRFRGGHLDGQTGRELRGDYFRIGLQADCQKWS